MHLQGDETEPPPRATVSGMQTPRTRSPQDSVSMVGKTQIALKYVHHLGSDYDTLWCIPSPPSPPLTGNAHLTNADGSTRLQHARRHHGAQRTRRSVYDLAVVETDGCSEQVDFLKGAFDGTATMGPGSAKTVSPWRRPESG